jgi:hypothetical protein
MRLNGVMLAATAFILNPQHHSNNIIKILVAGSGLGSAVSIGFCLLVVSVDWPFLGLVEESDKKLDFSKEFFHLQHIANLRQIFYRIGWIVSLISTAFFLIVLGIFFVNLIC